MFRGKKMSQDELDGLRDQFPQWCMGAQRVGTDLRLYFAFRGLVMLEAWSVAALADDMRRVDAARDI